MILDCVVSGRIGGAMAISIILPSSYARKLIQISNDDPHTKFLPKKLK